MTLTGIVIGGTGTGTGTGSVGVPDVVTLPQADAEAKLRQFDLVPRSQTIEADGPDGTVFSQNPAARTIRARGTVVTLLVIKAPVVPPDLGKQLTDLQDSVNDLTAKVDDVVPAVQAVGAQVDGVAAQVDDVSAKVDDASAKIDGLTSSVATLETDTAAGVRNKAILDKLDAVGKAGGGGGTSARSSGASRSGT